MCKVSRAGCPPRFVRTLFSAFIMNQIPIEMPLDILQVKIWSEVYSSVIEDTKGYVEKKQASTYEELVAEQELKAEEVSDHTSLSVQHYRLSACMQCQIGQVSLPLM